MLIAAGVIINKCLHAVETIDFIFFLRNPLLDCFFLFSLLLKIILFVIFQTFAGNVDRHSIVENLLSEPITARYIRIHPVAYHAHMSMRIELRQC